MFQTKFIVIAMLLTISAVAGLFVNWPKNAPKTNSAQIQQPLLEKLPTLEIGNTPSPESEGLPADEVIAKGDHFVIGGNFDFAKRYYGVALRRGNKSAALKFRIGVASELEGRLTMAELFYQKAIQTSDTRNATQFLAELGLARIWWKTGRPHLTKQLLAELALKYLDKKSLPPEISQQINSQICVSLLDEFQQPSELQFEQAELNVVSILDLLKSDNASVNAQEIDSPIVNLRQRPETAADLVVVEVRTPVLPTRTTLELIAKTSELTISISPTANERLTGRPFRIDQEGISIAQLLDWILWTENLVWTQDAERIQILHESELDAKTRINIHRQRLQRSNRKLALSGLNDLRRKSAMLSLGNLSLDAKEFDIAATYYNELGQQHVEGELSAKLNFNTAMMELRLGRIEGAIERFYRTIDQSLQSDLQAKSYNHIAKIFLDLNQPNQAVTAAARGLGVCRDKQIASKLSLSLSRGYLLIGDPFSANKVLFEHPMVDSQPIYERRLAAVFGAYSRTIGTIRSLNRKKAIRQLVVALAELPKEEIDMPLDSLIVSKAFDEVGLVENSIEVLSESVGRNANRYWYRTIKLELGKLQMRQGQLGAATQSFMDLAKNNTDDIATESKVWLASIAINDNRPEDCQAALRSLWKNDLPDRLKEQCLILLGDSFQKMSNPHMAAICYSGMIPDEFLENSPERIQ